MYNLKRIGSESWSLTITDKAPLIGSLRQICKCALELGFDMVEIEDAVNEMAWMDHDVAYFGVMKRFIYTCDTKEKAA